MIKMNRSEGEKIVALEVKVQGLDDKIDKHIDEQREDFNKINSKIDKVYDKLDEFHNVFASKWVEKGIIAIGVSLFGAIVWAVVQII